MHEGPISVLRLDATHGGFLYSKPQQEMRKVTSTRFVGLTKLLQCQAPSSDGILAQPHSFGPVFFHAAVRQHEE